MGNAFATYLPRFDPDTLPDWESSHDAAAAAEAIRDDIHTDPIAEAEERGRQAGRAAALAEAETLRAEALVRTEHLFAETRQRWTEEESARLAAQFHAAIQTLEAVLAAGVARVLAPFVTTAVRERALAEFSEAVRRLLAGGGDALVTVSGPEDLVNAIRHRLGEHAGAISFSPDATTDVRATAGETVVESQLQAWMSRLAAAA